MTRSKHRERPKPIKKRNPKPSRLPQYLILGGILVLVIVMLVMKKESAPPAAAATGSELPQVQLDAALNAGQPVVAFFHSNNCEQCLIMMDTVEQVFPEFSSLVALVDVNVYDPNNEPLLRRVRLQYIPTLIFYNRKGQSETFVGVMAAETLQSRLTTLAGAE